MAKLFALVFALCVVPSIVTAGEPLKLTGTVLCDLCAVGYETTATKPLKGAVVDLICTKRTNVSDVTLTQQTETNSLGQYKMDVVVDQADNICNVILVKSLDSTCNTTSPGREQSRVILTCENGLATNQRFANTLLFESKIPLASCQSILQSYQEVEDEN